MSDHADRQQMRRCRHSSTSQLAAPQAFGEPISNAQVPIIPKTHRPLKNDRVE